MGHIDPIITTTQSRDISEGGVRLILWDRFENGTLLKLKFLLPGFNRIIVATGQIVWTQEVATVDAKTKKTYDAGIEFIYVDSEDRKKITEYVSYAPASG
jgi:c-di-GMP-binding flagellar brake protein YcgR